MLRNTCTPAGKYCLANQEMRLSSKGAYIRIAYSFSMAAAWLFRQGLATLNTAEALAMRFEPTRI